MVTNSARLPLFGHLLATRALNKEFCHLMQLTWNLKIQPSLQIGPFAPPYFHPKTDLSQGFFFFFFSPFNFVICKI